jgi:hypothetical protein
MSETRHYAPGSDDGAENWACLASLIETCKLNGVNPQQQFQMNPGPASRAVFPRLPPAWAVPGESNMQQVADFFRLTGTE